jgi:dipeptidyl aminopeptidase/acylaminoacyl peptidase
MFRAFLFALVAAATAMPVSAQQPLSVEDFYKAPAYGLVRASRNGRYLAVTVPTHNNRLNLAVVDLETRQGTTITSFRDFDVVGSSVRWVGNERLVFSVGQRLTAAGDQEGGGLFVVGRDGKQARKLSPTIRELRQTGTYVYRPMVYLRGIPNNDEEILVEANLRDAASADVYRLNVINGRTTLLTPDRPTRTFDWVLDVNRVPRVATMNIKDTNTNVVYYRKDETSRWEEIWRYELTKPGMMEPLYFEADNKTLVIAHNQGRENLGIYRFDPEAKKVLDLLQEHPKFDSNNLFRDPATDEVVGFTIEAERPETVWLTEANKRRQRQIDAALPNTKNTFTQMRGDQYLITSFSDRIPTTWYILDEGKRTLEELFTSQPWLKDRLVEMRPFFLKTRDGLEILSYYFLPKDYKPGTKLPTVVHIHGGPAARADYWGRFGFGVLEAQLLASRGYAVVVPNFRITPTLGNKIYYGGFGTFGRQMMDDHEDAAKWAVAQGFADPSRICISGASYGGYATLMALARFPDTFRCGVAGLVVSDVPLILTSPAGDIPYSESAVQFWKNILGVKELSEIPRDVSPVNLADRIKNPIMFYAGADDFRTPLEQTSRMIRALERAGNKPKSVVIKGNEYHGFAKLENNIELYNEILKFLDEQIGPGSKK